MIGNMPVGTAIPVVIVTGRWRTQTTVNTTACSNTAMPASQTHLPQNQSQGDIPKFAIATGSEDQVECVLRKVGIADTEFTDPSGTGRINLFQATGSAGARVDGNTPSASTLMGVASTLNSYDVLMLPCEGSAYTEPAQSLANLIGFTSAGGRVYSSHFAYEWLSKNPPFDTVADWTTPSVQLPDGIASVDLTAPDGSTLSAWLQEVGASTTPGQIAINTLRKDFSQINAPTESQLRLNNATYNNPVMQMVFNMPIGGANQCGRVLFNEYHVENPTNSPKNVNFPSECSSSLAATPQEKLLEYSLFELTSEGSAATLTPATQDFGSQAIGFNSAPQTFTWTNNSTFSSSVTTATATGDFSIVSNNCSNVPSSASCQIVVIFNPTALGARTGALTVGSSGSTLTSTLTGTGVPDLFVNLTTLTFGSIDVGSSQTQAVTLTNNAPGAVPLPSLVATGDYALNTNCGSSLASNASCTVNVIFTPTTTGTRPGTLSVSSTAAGYSGANASLTGVGIDFTVAAAPASGAVIAGYSTSTVIATVPLAGFAHPLQVSCATNAPASVCTMALGGFTPAGTVNDQATITTTSEYTVVGYPGGAAGGSGAPMLAWLLVVASGGLLTLRRRTLRTGFAGQSLVRAGLWLVLSALGAMLLTGCSGKLPAMNPVYTPATGSGTGYIYTITETDGFLVHTAKYTLKVTVD
jgi:hypothetical protein